MNHKVLTQSPLRSEFPDYGTHVPVLLRTLQCLQPSRILEFGSGVYSTPLLAAYCLGHEIATCESLENDPAWFDTTQRLDVTRSHVRRVQDWQAFHLGSGYYDLIFLDWDPEADRGEMLGPCTLAAKVVVLHDANYPERYHGIWDHCHMVLDQRYRFHTACLSRTLDVTRWWHKE